MSKLKFLPLACIAAGLFLNAHTQAASNSMVRFQIRYGSTPFANLDVELFDSQRPITVSNFLWHVQENMYDRTFLHRVVNNFIVQGGLYSVDNPYPNDPFLTMKRIPEGTPITNEFNVGQPINNTFGTLAMALSSTNIGGNDVPLLDSATASWFFNIVDNTDQLPNYCVFGRVKTGASKLKFFNTLYEDSGIINMFGLSFLFSACDYPEVAGEGPVALNALPVAYFFFDCPWYSDLFNVQIRMISGRDVSLPKITIAPVGVKQTISNATHEVSAAVTDNMGVGEVRVYLGNGPAMPAVLNTNNNTWSVTLTNIPPGTNIFFVEATDTSGNRATKSATFFRSVPVPVELFLGGTSCVDKEVVTTNAMMELVTNIVTVCAGSIQGATNGQFLEVGRRYTLTAKAPPGNIFAGWYEGGNLISTFPTYSIIPSELTTNSITAHFNTNLFPYVKGTYTGLFCDTNQVEEWNSGFITLTVGDLGAYTAKVMINNKTFPIGGTFNSADGYAQYFLFQDQLNSSNDLFIRLNLDLRNGSDHISGTLSNYHVYTSTNLTSTNVLTNQWVAELHADRPAFSTSMPAPQAGKYTLLIPADPLSINGPFGDGYGTATVNTRGSLSFSGSLPDGTKVTQKVPISKNGDWPLYLNLYKGKGTLLSKLVFDTNQLTTDVSGLMNWFKRTQVAKYFPGGFTNESMIVGSRFIAPTGTNRLLALNTAVAGFTNGNLVADFANDVTVDAAGKVTNQDTNKLTLSLSRSSGLMSGSVTPPGATKAIPFKGAILQKQNRGSGYFLNGTNASGRVSLGE